MFLAIADVVLGFIWTVAACIYWEIGGIADTNALLYYTFAVLFAFGAVMWYIFTVYWGVCYENEKRRR